MKVAVVGQVPPPFGGQAMMIASMLGGTYEDVELVHVPMAFSREMDEMGHFAVRKLGHLLTVVWHVLVARARGATVLYYPPSGPSRLPLARDVFILICARRCFPRTVFHFHAGGLSEVYEGAPGWKRALLRAAFDRPDLAIVLSSTSPPDAHAVRARRQVIIPCGVPDPAGPVSRGTNAPPTILSLGMISESKGTLVFIEACVEVARSGRDFNVVVAGRFSSPEFEAQVRDRVAKGGLTDRVTFPGVVTGDAKDAVFRTADVFCFPTFFEQESFPIVLLEAEAWSLPVVTSDWRGTASIVVDGETGYLVAPHDVGATADRIAQLLDDAPLRDEMGRKGRARYEAEFTEETYRRRLGDALRSLESPATRRSRRHLRSS